MINKNDLERVRTLIENNIGSHIKITVKKAASGWLCATALLMPYTRSRLMSP